jgi:hypothetical protein
MSASCLQRREVRVLRRAGGSSNGAIIRQSATRRDRTTSILLMAESGSRDPRRGVRVETDRSSGGPINRDWGRVQSTGRRWLREPSHAGASCFAVFSLFPAVVVGSTRPVKLRLKRAKCGPVADRRDVRTLSQPAGGSIGRRLEPHADGFAGRAREGGNQVPPFDPPARAFATNA